MARRMSAIQAREAAASAGGYSIAAEDVAKLNAFKARVLSSEQRERARQVLIKYTDSPIYNRAPNDADLKSAADYIGQERITAQARQDEALKELLVRIGDNKLNVFESNRVRIVESEAQEKALLDAWSRLSIVDEFNVEEIARRRWPVAIAAEVSRKQSDGNAFLKYARTYTAPKDQVTSYYAERVARVPAGSDAEKQAGVLVQEYRRIAESRKALADKVEAAATKYASVSTLKELSDSVDALKSLYTLAMNMDSEYDKVFSKLQEILPPRL